jgi:hypothetical protein
MRQAEQVPAAEAVGKGLEDLVEDFAARAQAGEAVDAEAYARAHPAYAEELRLLLPAVLALADLGRSAPSSVPVADAAGSPRPGSATSASSARWGEGAWESSTRPNRFPWGGGWP